MPWISASSPNAGGAGAESPTPVIQARGRRSVGVPGSFSARARGGELLPSQSVPGPPRVASSPGMVCGTFSLAPVSRPSHRGAFNHQPFCWNESTQKPTPRLKREPGRDQPPSRVLVQPEWPSESSRSSKRWWRAGALVRRTAGLCWAEVPDTMAWRGRTPRWAGKG